MDFNPEQALEKLNRILRQMKEELDYIDTFFKKNHLHPEKINIPKTMVVHMHEIYDDLESAILQFADSHDLDDLNVACIKTEILEPAFELNFGEILGKAEVAGYQFPDLPKKFTDE